MNNNSESFAFAEGGANELARLINQEITECQSMGADEGSFAIHTVGRYQVQIRVTREYDNKLDTLMSGVAVPASDEAEESDDDFDEDDDDADNEEELAAFIKDDEDREEREEEEAFDREVHDEIMAGQDSRNVEELRTPLLELSMLGLVTLRNHLEKSLGKQSTAGLFFTLMGKEDRVDAVLDSYTSEQITAALEAVGLTTSHPDRDVEELFGETDDLAAGIQSEEDLERLEESQYREFPSPEGYNKEQTEIADMLVNKSGAALNFIHRGLKTMSLDESPFDPMTKVKRIRAILAYPVGHIRAVIRSSNLDTRTDFERHDPDHALVTSATRTKERCVQLAKLSREDLLRLIELIEQGEGKAGIVTTAGTHISTLIDHLVDYYTHAQVQSAAKELGLKLASATVKGSEL
ncbi:hypothetical protein Lauda_00033 [Pseudomonas phage vB_PpuM-Lauda]